MNFTTNYRVFNWIHSRNTCIMIIDKVQQTTKTEKLIIINNDIIYYDYIMNYKWVLLIEEPDNFDYYNVKFTIRCSSFAQYL